ncbi:MAG: hypothetical protein ACRDZY_12115, partial [Acidimicrobiales bacterium]
MVYRLTSRRPVLTTDTGEPTGWKAGSMSKASRYRVGRGGRSRPLLARLGTLAGAALVSGAAVLGATAAPAAAAGPSPIIPPQDPPGNGPAGFCTT